MRPTLWDNLCLCWHHIKIIRSSFLYLIVKLRKDRRLEHIESLRWNRVEYLGTYRVASKMEPMRLPSGCHASGPAELVALAPVLPDAKVGNGR